jgi:NAD(P)-dependent dehydrogenase (short-subunit alcohol dehydrogenase family)
VTGKLHDQTALVTGASRGIGCAIALAFAAEGARVAITGRASAELDEVKQAVKSAGVPCAAIVADLAQPGAARRVHEEAVAALGPLDILVNNAGQQRRPVRSWSSMTPSGSGPST